MCELLEEENTQFENALFSYLFNFINYYSGHGQELQALLSEISALQSQSSTQQTHLPVSIVDQMIPHLATEVHFLIDHLISRLKNDNSDTLESTRI